MGEGQLVDLSLAQDLVMIGSQCDGNLDCFLLAIFSLYKPRKEKNGMGKKWGSFENLPMWKHKTKHKVCLGSCSFKMHLSFSNIGLGP